MDGTAGMSEKNCYFNDLWPIWRSQTLENVAKLPKNYLVWTYANFQRTNFLSFWHNVKMRMVFWHAHIRAIFPSDRYAPCILSSGIFLDLWRKQTVEERKNTRSHRSIRMRLTTCGSRLVSIRQNYQLPNNNDSQNTHTSQ